MEYLELYCIKFTDKEEEIVYEVWINTESIISYHPKTGDMLVAGGKKYLLTADSNQRMRDYLLDNHRVRNLTDDSDTDE